MKTFLPPVAAAMAIFLVVAAISLWRQNRAIAELRGLLNRAHASARQQHEDLLRTTEAHTWELRSAADAIAQLGRELEVARAAAGLESEREAADESPAAIELWVRQQRRLVQERYGDLFDRLALPGEKLAGMKTLLVELATLRDANRRGQVPARTTDAIANDLRALLGDEAYQLYQDFGREIAGVRPQVRRFASDAAEAGHPLTAAQHTALSRTIFEVTDSRYNPAAQGSRARVPDPASGLTPLDTQVLARATAVLSPEQLDLLRVFRIQEREALSIWQRSSSPAPAAPAGSTPAAP